MDVSIIIVAHKYSEYLHDAIKSALNQNFNGSYEVILSSDGNPELLDIANFYNIRFVLNEKVDTLKSWSSNVNNSLSVCSGRYIKMLHYDDVLDPNSISTLFSGINDSGYSMVFANAINFKNNDNRILIRPNKKNLTINDLLDKNEIHVGSIMFNRMDVISLGGFDTSLEYAEEYDFYLKLLSNGKKFLYIDDVVYHYRIHNEQKGTLSLSKNEKINKKRIINKIKTKYRGHKLVICGMATTINRKNEMVLSVNSIIGQVDKLVIYQNGYKDGSIFNHNPKVEIISSLDTGIDMGDAGKYYTISKYNDGNYYYFSIDDDIIYPSNYVKSTIKKINEYDGNVIVSYHGRILNKNPKSYYKDYKQVLHFIKNQKNDVFVHFGGTGVMAFDTRIVKITFDLFKTRNMADIWVGRYSQQTKTPILCLKHEQNWLNQIEINSGSIFSTHSIKDLGQNELIKDLDFSKIIVHDLLLSTNNYLPIERDVKIIKPKEKYDIIENTTRKKVIKNNSVIIPNLTGKQERVNNVITEVRTDKSRDLETKIKKETNINSTSISNTSKKFQKILPNRKLNLPIINLGKKSK